MVLCNKIDAPLEHPQLIHQGTLAVDHQHTLFYAQFGNITKPAVVVLHGGPGSSCNLSMLSWFDLTQHHVILFDQRGCGRSTPLGLLEGNNTQELVADIERLRRHLEIERWSVIGGSWGALLALLYVAQYPKGVHKLILRGAFLGSAQELTWFFQDLKSLVPSAWHTLTDNWTSEQKNKVFQNLTTLLHNGSMARQQQAANRWRTYENQVMAAMLGLDFDAENKNDNVLQNSNKVRAKYQLQAHFLKHFCFIEQSQLHKNIQKIDVPTTILHGTHDWICPPNNAHRLAQLMPHATLRWIAKATHTPQDLLILKALQSAVSELNQ